MLLPILVIAAAPCSEPERHQLDFWLGEWDVVVHANGKEARGTNSVHATLGGCAVEEDFHAEGPDGPWSGRSFSTWVPKSREWRQTWVDDSGGYLAFRGGPDGKTFVLNGETDMRMVFKDIGPDAFEWSWEKNRVPVMTIAYRRRKPAPRLRRADELACPAGAASWLRGRS